MPAGLKLCNSVTLKPSPPLTRNLSQAGRSETLPPRSQSFAGRPTTLHKTLPGRQAYHLTHNLAGQAGLKQ